MSSQFKLKKLIAIVIMLFGLSVLLGACSQSNNNMALLPVSTYSISGSVNGDIKQGVTIAVSGAVSASAATDANGNYTVSGLPNGSYTIIPSRAGYTFSQPSKSVVISGARLSGNDFTAASVLYSVTGSVGGAVQAGVAMTVSGTTEAGIALTTSITMTGGTYSVPNVPNGSYTVTPAKTGYSFSPRSVAVTIAGGNGSASFTAAVDASVKFNLSGTVSGDTKTGVTIAVTGAASGSASSDASGNYSIPNLPNGIYTVTASKPGYTFSGPLSVTVDSGDSLANNFTATAALYSISGTVTGDVKSGVMVTVSGTTDAGASFGPVETTTADDGSYSVSGVRNGDYTAVASMVGYLFNPAGIAVTINGGNSTGNNFSTAFLGFRADGGTGTNGTGGAGGEFYAVSYGSIKVRKSGTVDASFAVPTIAPDFGSQPFTVDADTTVPSSDDTAGALCQVSGGDGTLYIGDGNGTCGDGDAQITGLTIASGTTMFLFDQSSGKGSLRLSNDLVVNGILTTDVDNSGGLSIEANLIDVETTGKITVSATTPDYDAGEIDLGGGSGLTRTVINRGTIEAKGDGNGAGGYIYMEPSDLVVNYGTIDVSGGNNGGNGGEFDAYVDYGDFYSSGTVRMNGGNGDIGGETEYSSEYWYGYSCWIETAYYGNANGRTGDIIISGTWEAKGGDGANGNGGSGGCMYFQTDGIGTVTLNASMSVKGGNGSTGSWGGSGGEIDVASELDPYGSGGYNDPTPSTISIAGAYDVRGGNGDQDGGSGGYLYFYGDGVNSSAEGSDVKLVGFPVMSMNGGAGGQNGGCASGNAFELHTYSYDGSTPAKWITNEADIQAKGGNASLSGGTGGNGGYLDMQTGTPGDTGTILINSGNLDVSGGNGDTGGSADTIYLQAQHVDNSGNLTANGGTGTTGAGGNGGNITVTSDDGSTPTTNTGTSSVNGGAGSSAGSDGTITIGGAM